MRRALIAFTILFFIYLPNLWAYWIWTPKTGKWINPKYAVKESPEKQLEFAKEFYDAGDFNKAKTEFEKLIVHYPRSLEAAEAQYYIGLCLESQDHLYPAFKAYQEVINKYPFTQRIKEIIERQYKIGEKLLEGKVGVLKKIAGGEHPVIEVFNAVANNDPYGKYAAASHYKIGLFLKNVGRFSEAREEFEKIVNEYPQSEWVKAAKYQIALSDAENALPSDYDQEVTKEAIKEFKDFVKTYPEADLSDEAKARIDRLKEKEAESNFKIAQFYEKQKIYESAKIYYKYVTNEFPNTTWAVKASERLMVIEEMQ